MTSAQLELIATERDWKLDKRTVEVGKAGLAQARAALAAATAVKEEYLTSEPTESSQQEGPQRIAAVGSTGYNAPGYVAQTLPVGHQAAA